MDTKLPKELEKLGLTNIKKVYYNLSFDELHNHEIERNECKLSLNSTAMCDTGIFTGRSPKDKYFVKQSPSSEEIAWGNVNKPISKETYNNLLKLSLTQLSNKDIYINDVYAGASIESRKK